MTTARERELSFPIRKIWKDTAGAHRIHLREFSGREFLPVMQEKEFPLLVDLAGNSVPYGATTGIRVHGTAFEGSNQYLSLAYFGREVEKYPSLVKEDGLIRFQGRRIYVMLNGEGRGRINVEDKKLEEASAKLGEDNLGSLDHSWASYGLKQRDEDMSLPGVREFLETLLAHK